MNLSDRRISLSLAVATVGVCLGFAAFTGHIWEDYFITFRASANLANGHGLVFQPGERVHSFTSPLGTLLPALFAVGGGEHAAVRALWCLRVVSAVALGTAVWLAARRFQTDGVTTPLVALVGAALVLDPKIVDFSMNGMETGLLVLFVTLTWHAFMSGARRWPCAIAFAGLQWTRPDGCVFFAVIAAAWIVFGGSHAGVNARERLLAVVRAVVVGGLLYLPWIVFAGLYYGSPIPHTIVAKAYPRPAVEIAGLLARYPWDLLFGHASVHEIFKPTYHFFGGWPAALLSPSRLLATGAALAWVWPRVSPAGRTASAAFFLGGFYIAYIPLYPWYYPGWQAIAWIAWAYLLHALWTARPPFPRTTGLPRSLARLSAAVIVALQGSLFVCVAWQMRTQQRLIEEGHRREIGEWLARTASRDDTVFLECLGYIGYYSGLKMLDFPGLSSREVVAARREGKQTFAQVIQALKPDWIVLRPREESRVFGEAPALQEAYEFVREFNVRDRIDELPLVPGRGYLNFDAVFRVYHRIPPAETRE